VNIEPIHKKITVPVTMDKAFAVFTQQIGSWWPHETHSIGLEHTETVIIEEEQGGRLYEIVDDGTEHDWGAVLIWDPPRQVTLSWHVGRGPEVYTEVDVTFEATEEGTVVHLEHRNWERLGDPGVAMRVQYNDGWNPVLARYVDSINQLAV
jgi:uncharacterized protein YndB with AHSA1/START domain